MAVTLSSQCFIDLEYFNTNFNSTIIKNSEDQDKLYNILNYIVALFEHLTGRILKARDFSSDVQLASYSEEYTNFDGPRGNIFWFPTYPVNSITSFSISGTTISAATDYQGDTGYLLYKELGKLIYFGGFDYGYFKNIVVNYNAGYGSTHKYYSELQYLTYLLASEQYVLEAGNENLIAETIGNYKYVRLNPRDLEKFKGLYPKIYYGIMKFRREVIV
jgi:hypothetical protein